MSRMALAGMASKDGRYGEARGHLERMIELNGCFPTFEIVKQGPIPSLELWLGLLEKTENYQRCVLVSASSRRRRCMRVPWQEEHLAPGRRLLQVCGAVGPAHPDRLFNPTRRLTRRGTQPTLGLTPPSACV